jgi:hypothetical protein
MGIRLKVYKGTIEAAVLGGAVLGGGGGGWIEEGRELARIAVDQGFREVLAIEDVPEDALLLTVSAVGAPSAGSAVLKPEDYVRSVKFFQEKTGMKIGGLISSEIGALGIVNGWVQSAFLNIPVIDAPCNGRAHPLGLMGSMALHRDREYVSFQTAVGGDNSKGNRIEAFFSGSLQEASKLVREASVKAGGLVAVARNPVPACYVKKNGAPGAIRMALGLGKILLEKSKIQERNKIQDNEKVQESERTQESEKTPEYKKMLASRKIPGSEKMLESNKILEGKIMPEAEKISQSKKYGPDEAMNELVEHLGGDFLIKARVEKLSLRTEGGLDVGQMLLSEGKGHYGLTFWNEYMTLEADKRRIATFPDLIVTFDCETALPLISAQIKENCEVFVITVPSEKLILGAGVCDPALLKTVESAIGKEVLKFIKVKRELV